MDIPEPAPFPFYENQRGLGISRHDVFLICVEYILCFHFTISVPIPVSVTARFNPIGPTPRPGIAVTFDDGYLSTLTTAAPILIKHNIPFHVFVTKSYCQSGNTRYLTETLLRELAAVPLASFGTTHFDGCND